MSTIAVVEDEDNVIKYVCINLEARGYTTLQAKTAEDGVKLIHSAKPDLVLLDFVLGAKTGDHVLEAMQDNPATQHIPVIIMSASANNSAHDFSQYANVQDVIAKPMTVDVLTSTIVRILRGKTAGE